MVKGFWLGSVATWLFAGGVALGSHDAPAPELRVGPVQVMVVSDTAQQDQNDEKAVAQEEANEESGPSAEQRRDIDRQQVKLGDYWLGIHVFRPDDDEQAQAAGLPKDRGVLVQDVVDDSPAAKAGIKKGDILLKAGETSLKWVGDLIKVINEADGKEVSLVLTREGEEKTVNVKPAKRPKDALPQRGADGSEAMEKWLRRFAPDGDREMLRFRFIHPGVILPPGAPAHAPLPGNMSVTISKQGDKPADIVVKRGDDKWEVTEKQLDKLPADVRPHVERMLGGWAGALPRILESPPGARMPFGLEAPKKELIRPAPKVMTAPEGRAEKRLEKKIDDLNQQVEQLRRTVEQLRQSAEKTPGDKPEQK